MVKAKNNKVVVYSGDDAVERCLYRFVSDSSNSLDKGELFVADIKKQKPNLEDLNIIKKVNFYDKKVNIYIIKITIEILLVCVFVAVFFLFQKISGILL